MNLVHAYRDEDAGKKGRNNCNLNPKIKQAILIEEKLYIQSQKAPLRLVHNEKKATEQSPLSIK